MSNELRITGNLTRDPELRYTQSGKPVASFTVADNRRVRDQSGNWVDGNTLFMQCAAWEELGENVAESLRKGMTVTVTGRLEAKEYESNGVKVRGFELIASDVSVSLRRQRATVRKVAPSSNNQGNGYNGYNPNTQFTTDPYSTGAPF